MPETVQRPDERRLTAEYAAYRARRISAPEYDLRFMLEEDAVFDGQACRFLDGRQTELWLVPRQGADAGTTAR